MWRDDDENVATAKEYGDGPHEVVVFVLLAPLCRRTLQHQNASSQIAVRFGGE